MPHISISPPVLYFGTPVVLLTTCDPTGAANITPMSSAWALADRIVLGLGSSSQGLENLRTRPECVLNLPSAELWESVEKIARATGRARVPPHKARIGYEYVGDKFALGGFDELPSRFVRPPRIGQCPLQIEARVVDIHETGGALSTDRSDIPMIVETQVLHVHAQDGIVVQGTDHIDTTRWKPLFYVFRHYFGIGPDLGRTFKADR